MSASLKLRLRRAANRVLHRVGLHLSRADRAFEMSGLLARAASGRVNIATWVDVGASDGSWSLEARQHFPRAQFILFEPLAERQDALAELHRRHGFHVVAAAAGAERGHIGFAIDPALDGSGVAPAGAPGTRSVPVETIDAAVAARTLSGPFGLKLDTHGHELAVLAGAAATLTRTEMLVIEAYNFPLTPECLRFHELCAWLEARGYRCCDLADPMRRPKDGALWQMDLAFVRANHPMFANTRYD